MGRYNKALLCKKSSQQATPNPPPNLTADKICGLAGDFFEKSGCLRDNSSLMTLRRTRKLILGVHLSRWERITPILAVCAIRLTYTIPSLTRTSRNQKMISSQGSGIGDQGEEWLTPGR